jgi:hypothetical protein
MTEAKGLERRRRRTQLFDNLIKRRRYWELKRKLEIGKDGNNSSSIKYKYLESFSGLL